MVLRWCVKIDDDLLYQPLRMAVPKKRHITRDPSSLTDLVFGTFP